MVTYLTNSSETSAGITILDEDCMPTYRVSVQVDHRGVLVVTIDNEGGAPMDLAYVGHIGETTDLHITVNDEEVEL